MKRSYLTVIIIWMILTSAFSSFGQCTNYINPITGESTRYLHVSINAANEYVSLANDGQKIIFSYVSNLIVDPIFKVDNQTEIIFKTGNGPLVLKTFGDSKAMSSGYSISAVVGKEELKQMVGTDEIEFNTSKGPVKIDIKKSKAAMFNAAITCVQ